MLKIPAIIVNVTVSKFKMEAVNDFYKEEMENADSQFLKSPEKNLSQKEAKREYLKRIREIRKEYKKRCENYLLNEKKNIKRKKLKEKKEKFEKFKSESVDISLGFFEKLRVKKVIWLFNKKRKLKNFFHRVTPNFVFYHFFKLEKKKNKILQNLSDFYKEKEENSKNEFKKSANLIKGLVIKTTNYIEIFIKKIIPKILGFKNKEKVKKKKEEIGEKEKTGNKEEDSREIKENKKEEK